jgi:hypothetical protein
LTAEGAAKVEALGAAHLEELARLRPRLEALWARFPLGGG